MDNYRMNRSYCRSGYSSQNSCRYPAGMDNNRCSSSAGNNCQKENLYHHIDQMPLTMAYVPMQNCSETYSLSQGLQAGTIFPELCKPFCGKGGRGCP